MANPFNFEKAESRFVKTEVSKEFRELETKISQLAVARQWSLIGLAFYSFVQLVLLTLGAQQLLADISNIVCFLGILATLGFINQQIKHLKTLQKAMVVKRIDP